MAIIFLLNIIISEGLLYISFVELSKRHLDPFILNIHNILIAHSTRYFQEFIDASVEIGSKKLENLVNTFCSIYLFFLKEI